jgi:hypothetical protein
MAPNTLPRRDLLKHAATGTALAATAGGAFVTAVVAQTKKPGLPAGSVIRAADIVLKNSKVITVDSSFTIAQAIAIAGDRTAVGKSDRRPLAR